MRKTLHQLRTHPTFQTGCYGCHVGTITFGVSPDTAEVEASEKILRKDLDAYKRLRQEGIQPPKIGGSWRSEQEAASRAEIEHPTLRDLDPVAKEYLHEATQVARDIDPALSRFAETG